MGEVSQGAQPLVYNPDTKTAVITVDGELESVKKIPDNVKVFVTKVRSKLISNCTLSVCLRMYVCMYVCMHACMSVCLSVCLYVCMYVFMYVCMYLYIYMSLCLSVYLYI